jgi:cell division protein FtsL
MSDKKTITKEDKDKIEQGEKVFATFMTVTAIVVVSLLILQYTYKPKSKTSTFKTLKPSFKL